MNIEQKRSEIASNMLKLAQNLMVTGGCGAEEISPFCLEPMYRSAIFFAQRYKTTGSESDLIGYEDMKGGLTTLSERWEAASKCSSYKSEIGKLTLRKMHISP